MAFHIREKFSKLNSRFPFIVLLGAFGVLFALVLINRHTPFRGEHWAMLYSYLNAPNKIEGIRNVSKFVCFGTIRFQPLAFFIPLIPFLAFGNHYSLHLLYSIFWQIIFTYSALALLDVVKKQELDEINAELPPNLKFFQLFNQYPLPAAFLLVMYLGSDIMTWTMYSYLQIATCLVNLGMAFYLSNRKTIAIVVICLATLIYEPAWVIGMLFVAYELFENKPRLKYLLASSVSTLGFASIFYHRYQMHILGIENVPNHKPSLLLTLSWAQKLFLLCFKWMYAIVVSVFYFVIPLPAERGAIFELKIIPFIQQLNPFLLFLILLLAFAYTAKNRNRIFLWASLFGLFALIAWARTDGTPYVIHQFRYAYLLTGPLFILLYLGMTPLQLRFPKLCQSMFAFLCFFQMFATVQQGIRIQESMQPLAKFVSAVSSESEKEKVNRVVNGLIEGSVSTPKELESFIYNGQACLVQWALWTNPKL